MKPEDRYWAVDLPGLTEKGAETIVQLAGGLNITGPSTLNPKTFLTLSLDRGTVSQLASVLRQTEQLEGIAPGVLEEFEAWLLYSDPAS